MQPANPSTPSLALLRLRAQAQAQAILQLQRLQRSRALEQTREGYRQNPLAFATQKLGVNLWSRQVEILEAVGRYQSVAVRSGHKVGKSMLGACIALWWLYCYDDARVILTAPTEQQIDDIIWREIGLPREGGSLYQRVREEFGGPQKWPGRSKQGLDLARGGQMFGLATNTVERAAGISGAHLLFIADEASGVAEQFFVVLAGNRAGGARFVMLSNPTRTSGFFYDAFHMQRELWTPPMGQSFHVSSEESPNVIAGRTVIPGLAGPDYPASSKLAWGEDSAIYDVRVRGDFPRQATNCIVGLGLVEEAIKRHSAPRDAEPVEPLELGVDVARYGDDESTIAPRRGMHAYPIRPFRNLDGPQLAGEVMKVVREMRRDETERVKVKVDIIGVGASPYDSLKPFDRKEIDLVGVNVGSRPTATTTKLQFAKLRDQLWFALADWLREGGAIPDDPLLVSELIAPTYSFDAAARVVVQPKDEIQEQLKPRRSPDRAEALMLSVYSPPRGGTGKSVIVRRPSLDDRSAGY